MCVCVCARAPARSCLLALDSALDVFSNLRESGSRYRCDQSYYRNRPRFGVSSGCVVVTMETVIITGKAIAHYITAGVTDLANLWLPYSLCRKSRRLARPESLKLLSVWLRVLTRRPRGTRTLFVPAAWLPVSSLAVWEETAAICACPV